MNKLKHLLSSVSDINDKSALNDKNCIINRNA